MKQILKVLLRLWLPKDKEDNLLLTLHSQAKTLYDMGNYQEAIRHYDKALEIDPNSTESLTIRGLSLSSLKRYREAIFSYEKALGIDPKCQNALFYKSIALHHLGQYEFSRQNK